MGLSERQILTVIYGMCAYLALVAVTSVVLPKEINVYLIVVVWVGSLLGYWVLSYLGVKNRKAEASDRRTPPERLREADRRSRPTLPRRLPERASRPVLLQADLQTFQRHRLPELLQPDRQAGSAARRWLRAPGWPAAPPPSRSAPPGSGW